MAYIGGFVAAVPTANKGAFIEHAKIAGEVLKDCGALSVVDCWGDDVPDGELTSFPMSVKAKEDETVVFSWIVWPSKEASEAGFQKMMEDPRMDHPMPFDGKRMIFGGFDVVFEA